MAVTQVDELQIITGVDIPVPELGITVRQPRVREIAMLGEQQYFVALSVFKLSKEQLQIPSEEVTNWMIFQESLNQKIEGIDNTRDLLANFLQLFVTTQITITPRALVVSIGDTEVNIEQEQFDTFQQIVGAVGGASLLTPSEEEFKPRNKRAAEIAEKMKKARKRLAAAQSTPNQKREGFLARYIRAVGVATANSLAQVNDMTLLQLNSIMQTYLAKESYDLEIQSRLAGAKGDDKLVHWIMRSLEKENDSIGTI